MVKIAVYAVRYSEDIQPFIDHYYSAPGVKEAEEQNNLSLTIINNYGTLPDYPGITILNNVTRPDFSTGHLARSWNQCIINAFKDLRNPAVDCLVMIQIDAKFSNNWYANICEIPNDCYYFCVGRGDEMQFVRPEAIKRVGLYDERYCNIGHQEADYFLRTFIKIKNNCSILDYAHHRIHDAFNGKFYESQFILHSISSGNIEAQRLSNAYSGMSYNIFRYKWKNCDVKDWHFQMEYINTLTSEFTNAKEFRYYPYFEKDIDWKIYAA